MLSGARYAGSRLAVPRDAHDGRYVVSFALGETDAARAFFREFGFVVIRDVLSAEECARTLDEIWSYLESDEVHASRSKRVRTSDASIERVSRSNPATWGNPWTGLVDEGIVGAGALFLPQLLRNRQNPNLLAAYDIVLRPDGAAAPLDVLVSHDRFGLFRPTRGIEQYAPHVAPLDEAVLAAQAHVAHDERATVGNVHLDANPWRWLSRDEDERSRGTLDALRYRSVRDFIEENNHIGSLFSLPADGSVRHAQALVNLIDNEEADGGFVLVPGFHHDLAGWARATERTVRAEHGERETFIKLADETGVPEAAVRITLRAGSLVIWDQRTAHGSARNQSSRPRAAQFFKVFPRDSVGEERARARQRAVAQAMQAANFGPDLTEVGLACLLDVRDPVLIRSSSPQELLARLASAGAAAAAAE